MDNQKLETKERQPPNNVQFESVMQRAIEQNMQQVIEEIKNSPLFARVSLSPANLCYKLFSISFRFLNPWMASSSPVSV